MQLEDLGFDAIFADRFLKYQPLGFIAGRVSLEHRSSYMVMTELGEIPAVLTGKMHYVADEQQGLPVVGDWVAVQVVDQNPLRCVIHDILDRSSVFIRKEAGKRTRPQPVAANIDTVFVVVGLDDNFSVRRVERYLSLVWDSGASPAVILTKADVCDNVDDCVRDVQLSAVGVPVHAISVHDESGLDIVWRYMPPGKSVALLGSSGVGKSTLLNYLLGHEVQRTQDVRDFDSKGRHTTTHRQLFMLPNGGMVIDTPGMRELQLWGDGSGLNETFADIAELASGCRFADCSHTDEPGCRVVAALTSGGLDPKRFESYRKMRRELDYLERRQDQGLAQVEKQKWKKIHKEIKRIYKNR